MPASTSETRPLNSHLPQAGCPHSHPADMSPARKLATASTELDVEMSASKATSRSVTGRGGRKVLADLAGNDSPIIGLIPGLNHCLAARTPSCNFKSSLGSTKKPLIPPTADESSCNLTPAGENLLRSQVNLLLQKVESDAPTIHKPAPFLRALCHLHAFMDSPALKLVAPTPVNTPCSNISSNVEEAPSSVSTSDFVVSKLLNSTSDARDHDEKLFVLSSCQELDQRSADVLKVQDSGIKLMVDLQISPDAEAAASCDWLPLSSKPFEESGLITITESVLSGRDHHIMHVTPLVSEAYTLGKQTTRTLQFDSPDKVLAEEMTGCGVSSPDMDAEGIISSVREFEEDEASEWSILVNVSSPDQAKCNAEAGIYEEDSADSGNLSASPSNLHVNQKDKVCSSRRRGTPFPKGTFTEDDEEEEECKSDTEIECSDEEVEGQSRDTDIGECSERYVAAEGISLADVKEEAWTRKGLPRAEGKHIRFSYGSDDEI